MSHTYAQNVFHIVFSTKDRANLVSKSFEPQLWAYVTGVCQNLGVLVHAIGGTKNHIHLLVQVPPVLAIADVVNIIKANSSRWVKEENRAFAWQKGYAVFSVSASVIPAVARYIGNQEAHHKKMSFEDEFLALLQKHGAEYDPEFVFG